MTKFRSRGAQLLAATGKTHGAIAKAVKVTRPAVSRWLAFEDDLVPGGATRTKLLELYSIPETAWEERPKSGKLAPKAPPASVPPAPATPGPSDVDLGSPNAGLDAAAEHLRRIRRHRERAEQKGADAQVRQWIGIEGDAIAAFARLNRELQPQDEERFLRSPRFQAFLSALRAALRPYPEALAAAAAALEEAQRG